MRGRLIGVLLTLALAAGVSLNGFSSEYGRLAQPKPFEELPAGFRVLTVTESGPALTELGSTLSGSAFLDSSKLKSYREELGVGLRILKDRGSVPEQSIWLETFDGTEVFYSEYLVSAGKVIPQRYAHIGAKEWKAILGAGLKPGAALLLLGLLLTFLPFGAKKKS